MVTVEVGTRQGNKAARRSSVHSALVMSHSDFFKAAMSTETWQESKEQIVRLHDEDPEVFEVFYWFLYTGRVHNMRPDEQNEEWRSLVGSWALSPFLQSVSFEDVVVDAMGERMRVDDLADPLIFKPLYPRTSRTSRTSSVRKLVLELVVHE